jgi:hypothetical protein
LKFIDKVISIIGHSETTSNLELKNAGRKLLGANFQSVVPIDKVPKTRVGYCIVNTDKAGKPGTHWFAIAPNNDLYDSLEENGDLSDIEQKIWEKNCGQRALAFCLLHFENPILAMLL